MNIELLFEFGQVGLASNRISNVPDSEDGTDIAKAKKSVDIKGFNLNGTAI